MKQNRCRFDTPFCSSYHAKGLCNLHRQRLRDGVDPHALPGTKRPRRNRKNGGPCEHSGCDRASVTRKMCATHYGQSLTHGFTWDIGSRPRGIPPSTKTCVEEDCDRRANYFDWCSMHYQQYRRGYLKRDGCKDTLTCALSICSGVRGSSPLCDKHLSKAKQFSLTPEEFTRIVGGGICQLCGESVEGKQMHIDHDHSCCPGKGSCGTCVRGILCRNCNVGLGFLKDSIPRLEEAISYLASYEARKTSDE